MKRELPGGRLWLSVSLSVVIHSAIFWGFLNVLSSKQPSNPSITQVVLVARQSPGERQTVSKPDGARRTVRAKKSPTTVANEQPVVAAEEAPTSESGSENPTVSDAPENNTKPQTYKPAPIYPEYARRNQQEGYVVLEVIVSKNGDVAKVTVKESSKHRNLDAAAVETVKTWKYWPSETVVEETIRFKLF